MFDTPKSELLVDPPQANNEIGMIYKVVKGLNYLVMGFLLLFVITMFVPNSNEQVEFGSKVMMSISLLFFAMPYVLFSRALPPKKKMQKTTISIIVIYSLLVVLGMFYGPGSTESLAGSFILISINVTNLIFIIRSRLA